MKELRYTLFCDGPTDRALLPILTWLLQEHLPNCAIQPQWLDIRLLRIRPSSLAAKIQTGVQTFPCDLLFVHRDAEREPPGNRVAEIRNALTGVQEASKLPFICVVPIRMTEAWLLSDAGAIRAAAENRNGKVSLDLPRFKDVEDIPDPKETLRELLRKASALKGRRLDKFNVNHAAGRVADLTDNFASLRVLSAFQSVELEVKHIIELYGWHDEM